MEFAKIESALYDILDALSAILTVAERREVTSFVEVGEYGVALEALSALLVEEKKRVPLTAYSKMVELSEAMGIRASVILPELKERVT